jgi:hypothetical protein
MLAFMMALLTAVVMGALPNRQPLAVYATVCDAKQSRSGGF